MDLEGRYELLEKIGAGSYATVFRARDRELGREVAVKQIHEQYRDDPEQLELYWREAQLLASLHHPNIVTIFDIHRERGWLILELMQANLAERMAGRQMDVRGVRTTLANCLRALKYLHERGIVHGDIKLSNLMIDARRRIKIGDFGLAHRVSDEDGSLLKATTKYMAPETVSDEFGDVGRPSDLYSIGFTAYELLCGPNFEELFPGLSAFGRNKQVAWMMWHAAPDRRLPDIHRVLEGVPDDLASVIQKLIEKDQSKRYQSADDALSDLNIDLKIVKSDSDDEDELPHGETSNGPDRKRLWLAAGAFSVSLIMSALMLFPFGDADTSGQNGQRNWYGVVEEIYLSENKVKVQDLEEGIPTEVDVGEPARIFLRNTQKYILLRDLKPQDRVEIEQTVDDRGKPVVKLIVSRPEQHQGEIRSIDLTAARLRISVEQGQGRDELTFRLPDRAQISLNGSKVALRDLRPGDSADFVHLHEASSQGGRVIDSLDARRLVQSAGYVEQLSPEDRLLTVRLGKDNAIQTIRMPIGKQCDLSFQGGNSSSTLAASDLKAGDRLKFWYDVEFRRIIVTRGDLQASGVISSVDPRKKRLVVQTPDNKRLRLRLDEDCDITLSLESADFDDLREYDSVEVTYDESKKGRLEASSIDAIRPVKSDRWAIVIGTESFQDRFLTRLPYAISDATLFKESLMKRYAMSDDRVALLIDESRDAMQRGIATLLQNARSQTQVVVYITSHAYVDEDGKVYLAGRDFNFDRMAETGLPLDWLLGQLDGCGSKDKILLFDACHDGSGKDLKSQPSSAEMLGKLASAPNSTQMIASCAPGQRGLIRKDKRHGMFAYWLSQGFGGRADRNRDLCVTAYELIAYLKSEMAAANIASGKQQTPVLIQPN